MENKIADVVSMIRLDGGFNFDWYCDWSSLIFWQSMNWRDFTWIAINTEISPILWFEIHIALLGLGFKFSWYRDISKGE